MYLGRVNNVWGFFSGGFILSATLGELLDTLVKSTTRETSTLKPFQKGWILGQWPSVWLFMWCKVRVESCVTRIHAYSCLHLLEDRHLHFVVKRIYWYLDLVNCNNKLDGFKCVKCYVLVCGVTLEVQAGTLRILYLLLTLPTCECSCPLSWLSMHVSLAQNLCLIC